MHYSSTNIAMSELHKFHVYIILNDLDTSRLAWLVIEKHLWNPKKKKFIFWTKMIVDVIYLE